VLTKEKTLWLRRPDLNQRFCQDVCASEGKAKAESAGGPVCTVRTTEFCLSLAA